MTTVPDLGKLHIDRDAPPPGVKRAFKRTLWLAGAAIVIVAALVLALRGGGPAPVQVVTVSLGAADGTRGGSVGVVANGYVVARTKAAVSAKIPGRLATLAVSEGSFLRKGAVIARLENADYAAAVSESDAQLASARATLLELEADRDQVQRDFARVRDLHAQNPNLVSAQEVETAESRTRQWDARASAQRSRVDAASAMQRLAQANLENTIIRAPFTGTVLRKEAEVGEVVAPSVGGGLTRGAVVTMADLTTLEVEVDVNEAYIARVSGGQRARITLDAYPDTAFRGVVRQVVPTADRQRATVQVKVGILDRDPRILSEMGARVDFLELETPNAAPAAAPATRIRVPAAAVRDVQGQTVVWIVRDGRLVMKPVQAGPVSGGFREVRSGLAGGELLLISGVDQPRDGLRVKVQTQP